MKFDHVHIKCLDLEKAVEFYEKIFGAKVFARQMSAGVPMVRLNLGGSMFNLWRGKGRELTRAETARESLYVQGPGPFWRSGR